MYDEVTNYGSYGYLSDFSTRDTCFQLGNLENKNINDDNFLDKDFFNKETNSIFLNENSKIDESKLAWFVARPKNLLFKPDNPKLPKDK